MKVLFIGNFLSKSRGTIGPSEQIVRAFTEEGLNVAAASYFENPIFRLLDIIIKSAFLNYRTLHIDTFSGKAFLIAQMAAFCGRVRSKNVVLTLHGGRLPEFYAKYPQRVGNVLNSANVVQSPSMILADFFKNKGIKVLYQPNFIKLAPFPYLFKSNNDYSILWVRAFSSVYNPDLAVKILHEVRKTYPDATLTMIGPDKGELKSVKELIKQLGLQDVVFITGPVPNEQLFRYFHSHSVYLNTTSYESFGVAVLEAAACGIPIVSSNVGEIPFLWTHEHDILLAEKLDATAFAEQISRIFDNKELAQKLSVNARQKAEQYDWQVIFPRWIELLERT